MTPDRENTVRELLAFYREAGVDALLDEAPVDRFADQAGPAAPAPIGAIERSSRQPELASGGAPFDSFKLTGTPAPSTPVRTIDARTMATGIAAAPPAADVAVMAAREAAKNAQTLDDLRSILNRFEGCALRNTATQLVFADGNPQARVMFVGEAPGRDEDIQGLPFVGRSGKLLDLMMGAIGIDRSSAYIANVIPWRPPGNRDPTPQETTVCLPFIKRQIELANPDILVCLGKPSAAALLGINEAISRTRGRWVKYNTGTREIRATVVFHPAYLLRQPIQKRLAWRDFLAIKKALAPH